MRRNWMVGLTKVSVAGLIVILFYGACRKNVSLPSPPAFQSISGLTQITNREIDELCPSVSPDGEKVAFMAYDAGYGISPTWHIWYGSTQGVMGYTQVTKNNFTDMHPCWMRDSLYFGADRTATGEFSIWARGYQGIEGLRLLTGQGVNNICANISCEGKIAFVSYPLNYWITTFPPSSGYNNIYAGPIVSSTEAISSFKIWTVNKDGSELTELISGFNPVWSPDGSQIAYTSKVTGSWDIWVIDADGSNPTQLTSDPTSAEYSPCWSPDGKWIAYAKSKCLKKIEEIPAYDKPVQIIGSGFIAGTANIPIGKNGRLIVGGSLGGVTSTKGMQKEKIDASEVYLPSNLWIIAVDGSRPTQKTFDPYHWEENPDWALIPTPDGEIHDFIFFQTDRDGNYNIYRFDPMVTIKGETLAPPVKPQLLEEEDEDNQSSLPPPANQEAPVGTLLAYKVVKTPPPPPPNEGKKPEEKKKEGEEFSPSAIEINLSPQCRIQVLNSTCMDKLELDVANKLEEIGGKVVAVGKTKNEKDLAYHKIYYRAGYHSDANKLAFWLEEKGFGETSKLKETKWDMGCNATITIVLGYK